MKKQINSTIAKLEVRELVELKYGREAALDLLWRTPARILRDREFGQR